MTAPARPGRPIEKVLVANRGEIACRIIATLDRMGIASVAVYSDVDRNARHVAMAGEAVRISPAQARESYLDAGAILAAVEATGADAVHPGYGFLSENAAFADTLEAADVRFIGPRPDHIRLFGLKHAARDAARAADVPLLPGTDLLRSADEALAAADAIGYPVMVKSTAGGGGIGLQRCDDPDALGEAFERVGRLAVGNFSEGGVFLERFVARARHVEVQIFGDGRGTVIALGERDCSLQRRNQKVVEETPAPGLAEGTRTALHAAALRLARSVAYSSAGTVEFVLDAETDAFAFLEVNTRLQVEHPVTEAVTGIDLVEWMVREAAGDLDLSDVSPVTRGAAIEARLYAEDPARGYRPSAGRIIAARLPEGVRVDHWIESGTQVPAAYDPLLAKVIAHGADREAARKSLVDALAATAIDGIETNLDALRQVVASPMFIAGDVTTGSLAAFDYRPRTVEVIAPGAQSSLQDHPGRLGYWHVGVPPSGPMDARSHRLANRICGNAPDAPVLEMTLAGPTLRFLAEAMIALTGADMEAKLDGAPVARFHPVAVAAGSTLALGKVAGKGCRAYLAVRGGFDAPDFLGSRATFHLGGFGGHAGRVLAAGDVLRLARGPAPDPPRALPEAAVPDLRDAGSIGVLYGPHGAPDFFTDADIGTLLSVPYEVHFNSDRTGVRLLGPKPRFARPDGGEAGLHPSNIHDNAYAVGAIDFTGDMPIVLGPDGPSLGGFVCPFVVADAELWKIGQLKAGDRVRFVALSAADAEVLGAAEGAFLKDPFTIPPPVAPAVSDAVAAPAVTDPGALDPAVLFARDHGDPSFAIRRQGERHLLMEFGANRLDLDLRVRAHEMMERLGREHGLPLTDVTPGIRSLQIQYDPATLPQARLLDALVAIERELPPVDDVVLPSRIVHLPLAWDDSATRADALKYQETVRPDAPWCPWNIEFIRRINGLDTVEDVRRIVYTADYMIYGLGDVYLGAPVATPIDPRHRLVTTKYNPARTSTPENAVGIGGAYLCIYGMSGPGGYQFVGRTVQVWSTFQQRGSFHAGRPWLLDWFDRIRFFPVEEAELMELRAAFTHGRYEVAIEQGTFALADHHRQLQAIAPEVDAFRQRRESAFAEERARWVEAGIAAASSPNEGLGGAGATEGVDALSGLIAVEAPVPGSVWELRVSVGDRVEPGKTVAVLESMKMEVPVEAACAGRVERVLVAPGVTVDPGRPLVVVRPE